MSDLTEGEQEWLRAGLREMEERAFWGPRFGPFLPGSGTEDLLRRQMGLPESRPMFEEAWVTAALRPLSRRRRLLLWLRGWMR